MSEDLAVDELAAIMTRLHTLTETGERSNERRPGAKPCLCGTYHNHTTWSDGRYTPDDLVRRAIELGFTEIGITDHYYTLKGSINCVRDDQLTAYRKMVESLASRHASRIRVLGGIEIDTTPRNPNRLALPHEALSELDYVLFEYVGEERTGGFSLAELITTRETFSCEVGLAHPDMKNLIEQYGASELAQLLAEHNIFIDACGSARNSRNIPYEKEGISRGFTLNIEQLGAAFKTAAQTFGVKFIPSSDTHCDDTRDGLAATVNAMVTMHRYGFERKQFD